MITVDEAARSAESARRRPVQEAVVAVLVVGLTVAAVMLLPLSSANEALLVLVLLAAGAIVNDGRPIARHGLRWPPKRGRAQALTLVALPVGMVFAYAIHQTSVRLETGHWLQPLGKLHLNLFSHFFGSQVVWAALPEELLFRGFLQTRVRAALGGGLARRGRAIALTIALVAAFNVVAHWPIVDARSLVGVGLLGIVLSWLRERTGSLIGPFACHAAYNATLAWVAISHA